MVAMDQRESLRHMFDLAGAGRPADDVLIRFKLDVAEALGPLASGFLIDRHFGFEAVRDLLPAGHRPHPRRRRPDPGRRRTRSRRPRSTTSS